MNPYDETHPPYQSNQDQGSAGSNNTNSTTSTAQPHYAYHPGDVRSPSEYIYNPDNAGEQPDPAYNAGSLAAPPANSYNVGSSTPPPDLGYNVGSSIAQPDPNYNASTYPNYAPGRPLSGPPSAPYMGKATPAPATPHRGPRTWAILLLALVIFLTLGVGLFAGWQFGKSATSVAGQPALQQSTGPAPTVPPLTGNNVQTVRVAVIAKVSPAVVQVNVTTSQGSGIGSGVIIDKRGYIVTNNHVVQGAQTLDVVLYDGTHLQGSVVGTDSADDLAVIKVNPPTSNLTTVTLGDSSKLQVGQDVLAIGNPLGITQTVTSGIISALNRTVNEGQQSTAVIPNAIQTDAPINPGNSGGALVDLLGNLIGIPTLTAIDPEFNTPANGVGFAIPSNRVQFITQQIISTGKVTHSGRAALGIQPATVDPFLAAQNGLSIDHGVLIVSVQSGGPVDKAHLQAGDVIVSINGQAVSDIATLEDALLTKNPGDTVSVQVYRGSQQLTVNVQLGELQVG